MIWNLICNALMEVCLGNPYPYINLKIPLAGFVRPISNNLQYDSDNSIFINHEMQWFNN